MIVKSFAIWITAATIGCMVKLLILGCSKNSLKKCIKAQSMLFALNIQVIKISWVVNNTNRHIAISRLLYLCHLFTELKVEDITTIMTYLAFKKEGRPHSSTKYYSSSGTLLSPAAVVFWLVVVYLVVFCVVQSKSGKEQSLIKSIPLSTFRSFWQLVESSCHPSCCAQLQSCTTCENGAQSPQSYGGHKNALRIKLISEEMRQTLKQLRWRRLHHSIQYSFSRP